MSDFPLVSVIIPTYNSNPAFLEKAIQSVVDQTYKNIELIVVDDCSNSETRTFLFDLKSKYNFQLIILEKNSGSPSKPLNEGIKNARGSYIAVCAHDDYHLPNKLLLQVEYMQRNEDVMISYTKSYVMVNGIIKKIKQPFKGGWIFKELLLRFFYLPALTVMIKRECFNQVGYFDESLLIEDWDMWLRIANKFKIGYLNQYLSVYRHHESNIHRLQSERMLIDREVILKKWSESPCFPEAKLLNDFIDRKRGISVLHMIKYGFTHKSIYSILRSRVKIKLLALWKSLIRMIKAIQII